MPAAFRPLCPHVFQNSVAQLTMHLKNNHRMFNSANLLARIIVYTPTGKEEAFQVLKDVHGYELCLDEKNKEFKKRITNLETRVRNRDKNIQELSNQFSKNCKERTVLETEVKDLKKRDKELNEQLASKIKDEIVLNEDFKKYKSLSNETISEKDKKISKLLAKEKNLHISNVELEAELSEATKEQTSLQKDFKKYKKESNEKISEKNQKITELNLKIKDLYEDVELLKETQRKFKEASDELIFEKDMTISDLKNIAKNLDKVSNEVTKVSNEKNLLQDAFMKLKDCSSKTITEKDHVIANLDNEVRNLRKEVRASNAKFFDLDLNFSRHKELSMKVISEKDMEIANLNSKARGLDKEVEKLKELISMKCKENDLLQQDVKKCKQLGDEMIEKNKAENKKTLAEMELRFHRHREIFCLLKKSITGVADMYDDTDDKLLEAIKITSQSRKLAENNLVTRFRELEEEVARVCPEKDIFIPKISVKKDIFKQETVIAQNIVDDADTRLSSDGNGQKSFNKELDNPQETNGKERRSLNLKRKHV